MLALERILSKSAISKAIFISSSFYLFVGFVTWTSSPIDLRLTLFLLGLAFVLLYAYCGTVKLVFRWAILGLLLTAVDIFGVGTVHDLSVTVHATALCRDGYYSSSGHRQGTCSWHGGVLQWGARVPPWWEQFRR
jgi:hypothetical protein